MEVLASWRVYHPLHTPHFMRRTLIGAFDIPVKPPGDPKRVDL